MKKLLSFLLVAALSASVGLAQTQAKKAKGKKAPDPAMEQADHSKVSTASGPMKKDGTPDKRYKANKEADKPVTGPKKKDGTPDMRYKANKDAEKK